MAAVAVLAAALTPGVLRAEITAAEVQRAINGGVQYLRSTQLEDGRWPEYSNYTGGLTSLCTLALLNSGVAPDDPAIRRAMHYLRGLTPEQTYSVSLQTMVFCQLGSATDIAAITRNVRWLEAAQQPPGDWSYRATAAGSGDPSNTQFALLALGAAEERGVRVNPAVFEKSQQYWLQTQKNTGGWTYDTRWAKGSMTCAGIASLVICKGRVSQGDARIEGDNVICCGGDGGQDDPIERGLDWLGKRFSVRTHPGSQSESSLFYYLYALERVGRMTGRRLIGGHDWYREGAEYLVSVQDPFQNWWRGRGFGETDPNVTTSFALLFLSKGKRQVVIGRLHHPTEPGEQWQRHAGGLQQLVRHVERSWGRDLTWQTIELEGATTADLLQAPVLVISGSGPLAFSDDQADLLKSYVDQGGCILFEANAGNGCGDAGPFERSVGQLCRRWFPTSQLEKLPPNHPVWSAEGRVQPSRLGKDYWLYGVQACCRTAVMYTPQSLTCRWELSDPTGHRAFASDVVRAETSTAAQLGQNIIAYATGRELKDKLDARSILVADFESQARRGVLRVARLAMATGNEEAARALPNLTMMLKERFPVRVVPVEGDVPLDAEQLAAYPILWVHGRTEFEWTPFEREQLRTFVENGGIVLADAICGSEAFAAAFRRQWALVMPDSPLRPMPADHPALSAQYGYDLSNVTLRRPAGGPGGVSVTRRQGPPVIEVAEHDGLAAAYLSPFDLSCALESPNSIQCPGYDTSEAAKIGINLILYSLQQ